jgi:hypothetical protein
MGPCIWSRSMRLPHLLTVGMDDAQPGSVSSGESPCRKTPITLGVAPLCGGKVAHRADMGHVDRLPRGCLIPEHRIGDECLTRRDESRARRRMAELKPR